MGEWNSDHEIRSLLDLFSTSVLVFSLFSLFSLSITCAFRTAPFSNTCALSRGISLKHNAASYPSELLLICSI